MNTEQFKQELIERALECGFPVSKKQSDLLYLYKSILLEWNEKMNLTAITEDVDIIHKHYIDSLFVSKAVDIKENELLVDIGTGAGFPGIPLKIFLPHINLTLVDSLNKRISFLNTIISTLGLDKVTAIHSRAEDFKQKAAFDICCARAVARLNILTEWCLPFVKVGGCFVAMKGTKTDEEVIEAKNAIKLLGGEISEIYRYNLAKTDICHSIIVIKKLRQTPQIYPRTNAKIAKAPLI